MPKPAQLRQLVRNSAADPDRPVNRWGEKFCGLFIKNGGRP